jgi:nitrite reductase/ring-hydroxylating ferredoxin subunit
MTDTKTKYVVAARTGDVPPEGFKVVTLDGHAIVLVNHEGNIYALDNRCPHMGFPLQRGSLSKGILTCDWHHARFDLCSGGTFDEWADDARTFPVDVRDGEILVDTSPRRDLRPYYTRRLREGLERRISLVLAKGTIALVDMGVDPAEPFRVGLEFGSRYRESGWFQGLTQHVCFMNLIPHLDSSDVPRALYQGLRATAFDSDGQPARFVVEPLPDTTADLATLKRWLRDFIEVRDAEGAERCVISAVRARADHKQMADMLFAAATDHRYIAIGHSADFINKAFEALDIAGWEHAELVLTSVVSGLAMAPRSEESLEWRHPVDVVAICERAFEGIEAALEAGRATNGSWSGREELVPVLLGVDAKAIADALLAALANGAAPDELASAVAHAAALRIARFPTSNEFGDWDTALHTYSFANAIHQGMRRSPSAELVRGVFDAAMSVYLDRFLNAPAAQLPERSDTVDDPESLLAEMPALLDRQQQVHAAGRTVALYLNSGGDADKLLAMLGKLLLREDRDFHTIQTMEASFRQFARLRGTFEGTLVLAAAARYLAAHAPTPRAQGQTYRIAYRLHRGEDVYEESDET